MPLSIVRFQRAVRSRRVRFVALLCLIGAGGAAAYRLSRPVPPSLQKMSTEQLRVYAADHPSLEALGLLCRRTLEAGNREEGLEIARQLVRRFPSDTRAHNALGAAYAASQDADSARKAFHNAISLNPRFVDPYVNLGKLALLEGDNQQAYVEFDRATTVDPNSAGAWTGLGEASVLLHNQRDATESFKTAIRLAPDRPQAYAFLGTFLSEMGRGEEGRPHLQRALDLGYRSGKLYSGLAMAYADQPKSNEDLTKALDYAREAEKLGDSSSLTHYAKGLALQRLSRYQEAIDTYRKVINISANANGAWIGISQCYRAMGKTHLADEAAKTGERILTQRQRVGNLKYQIQSNPNRLDLREQYADMMMSNGQYLLAADQYRYVAMHSPDQPSKWLKVIKAFELAGEKDLADYVRPFARAKPTKQPHGAQTATPSRSGKGP